MYCQNKQHVFQLASACLEMKFEAGFASPRYLNDHHLQIAKIIY